MPMYTHQCGQRYVRTSQPVPPRHCLMICERCLEPMPICDDSRAVYQYEPIHLAALKRLMAPAEVAASPRKTKPPLHDRTITPMFPLRGTAPRRGEDGSGEARS